MLKEGQGRPPPPCVDNKVTKTWQLIIRCSQPQGRLPNIRVTYNTKIIPPLELEQVRKLSQLMVMKHDVGI